jgi:hypothetical protein
MRSRKSKFLFLFLCPVAEQAKTGYFIGIDVLV